MEWRKLINHSESKSLPFLKFEFKGEPNDFTIVGNPIFGEGEDYVVYMNNPRFDQKRKLWNDVPKNFKNSGLSY